MKIEKYSFGLGDRFLHQGRAQLQAIINAKRAGIDVVPVWNKSNREHKTIGTEPPTLRAEADQAVADLDWQGNHYVDADHINLDTVDRFLECSDFFTIDVANAIGTAPASDKIAAFVDQNARFIGKLTIPGAGEFAVSRETIEGVPTRC